MSQYYTFQQEKVVRRMWFYFPKPRVAHFQRQFRDYSVWITMKKYENKKKKQEYYIVNLHLHNFWITIHKWNWFFEANAVAWVAKSNIQSMDLQHTWREVAEELWVTEEINRIIQMSDD